MDEELLPVSPRPRLPLRTILLLTDRADITARQIRCWNARTYPDYELTLKRFDGTEETVRVIQTRPPTILNERLFAFYGLLERRETSLTVFISLSFEATSASYIELTTA